MCVCVSPSPRRLSGAGTYALGRPRSGGAPAASPGVGGGRAACHSRRLWGGGGGLAGRAAPRGSAGLRGARRRQQQRPGAGPARPAPPRPAVLYRGRVCAENGGRETAVCSPPPPPARAAFGAYRRGKEPLPAASFVYRSATPFFSRLSSPSAQQHPSRVAIAASLR